jgi:DNA-binding SARP family transcriptional activator
LTAPESPTLEHAFALLPADDAAARRAFSACLARAATAADGDARRLAAAGLVLAVASEFSDFRGLKQALAALDPGSRAQWPRCGRAEDRARLDAALVAVPLLDDGLAADDVEVAAAADRLGEALAGALAVSPDERMLLWKALFDYRAHRMDTTALARIAAQAQDFMRDGGVSGVSGVSGHWQARWWLLVAGNHDYFGADPAAADALARAGRLAALHHLNGVRYELLCIEMTAALKADAWPRAEAIAREIELALPDIRAGRLPAGLRAQAWWLLRRGEPAAALQRLDSLLAICADVEVPQRDRGAYHVLRSYALLALERFDEARDVLAAQQPYQRGEQGAVLSAMVGLVDGLAARRAGQPQAAALLADAIRRCAALGFERFLLPLPALAAEVAQSALDAGVETEFVSRAVRARSLAPPDAARPDWPWRLQVRVFGTQQVLRDGQPLPWSGKRPKKPLELLALIAAQGERALPVETAIDVLWPSPEAEAPKSSLEVALVRLRKLLDVPNAVLLGDDGLRLDRRIVWTDVAAFEMLEQRWWALVHSASPSAVATAGAGADAAPLARRALGLYLGPLLAGESLSPPWRALREQWARRFTRLVAGHGAALQAHGLWREAIETYEAGLAADDLAEPLYRALMRAQLQLGERAEALRSFGRCHDRLAAALSVAPSHETCLLRDQAAAPPAR